MSSSVMSLPLFYYTIIIHTGTTFAEELISILLYFCIVGASGREHIYKFYEDTVPDRKLEIQNLQDYSDIT